MVGFANPVTFELGIRQKILTDEGRDQPIMLILSHGPVLIKVPILCSKFKNKNCAWSIITICIQICMNKSLLIANNLE